MFGATVLNTAMVVPGLTEQIGAERGTTSASRRCPSSESDQPSGVGRRDQRGESRRELCGSAQQPRPLMEQWFVVMQGSVLHSFLLAPAP
jgi:hypothetical protein